ncbi:hypothetical protein Q5P01_009434 [Channa striata]|uniref:Ig-like domain-containing protein n=1 Tax=Channa striata TaxID=64152 RepID=A0AA88N427_CHASR|nr:hypothetical protein Q5P01_009434 [Channa striata]
MFPSAPVSSVLLVSECLSQGEMRVSCSSEGGDSPQYSWTLDGHTLTDAELLSGNKETNNITLKQHVSGNLVCSVRNHVSHVSKEETISDCGFIFINCTSSNGTHISQWVFAANNTLCVQPTTTTVPTVGKETETIVSAPVSSVLLVSECLSQGEMRVSCSSEGGDSPQYRWTLDGHTLTDAELLSGNNETNNITLKQHVSGNLVCSVRNHVSHVSKEETISDCAPVSSVLLVSECLSQGEMRVSCSSEGGDSPQYSWTLDGHTLTDAELLSGNKETNNITLKQHVSGNLVCSVRNHVSHVSKEETISDCGFKFINCILSNGTHISQWVFAANNTLCVEPTTTTVPTVAPVSSVLLVSECLSQGEMRVSCSSEGGDSPQYSWTLDGHTLTDAELLSGNKETNNITLKQHVSGNLVCSVRNHVSHVSKEETISDCGFIFINCTLCDGTHISHDGTLRINNLSRNDGGEYKLEIYDSDGHKLSPRYLQFSIQAPVSSVLLVSECLSQGEMRVSCSSEGGDSPQYSWTLDGHTLTDAELLSGNKETNNITLKQHVSGNLVCSVRNHVSHVTKEETISDCGFIFINCILSNGTHISQWVFAANNTLCVEPTTTTVPTVDKETETIVSSKPTTNISNNIMNQTASDDSWILNQSLLIFGLRAAVAFLILTGIFVYFALKKNKTKKAEDSVLMVEMRSSTSQL